MARSPCDLRLLLLAAAVAFIYIQVRLFATQSHYADRLAEAEKSENQCTSQLKSLIDQVSMQQEKIVALEEMKIRQDEERAQLKILIQDLEKRSVQKLLNKNVVPVAAVVIMACNRPDYLERTVESILKYGSRLNHLFPKSEMIYSTLDSRQVFLRGIRHQLLQSFRFLYLRMEQMEL
jgi:alpha-1,3-mannosyl-glycoprotein beta-1,2-N-acetylglucosaminyltransferase